MSTTGRAAAPAPDASDIAATLRDATLVQFVAHADGDAVAASGLLARAVAETGGAYQVSVARTAADAARRVERAEHTCVTVNAATEADGTTAVDATIVGGETPASVTAAAVVRALDATPDPLLVLAGTVAAGYPAGAHGSEHALEAAVAQDVERRPGVGVPTADIADGLAHTTLVHTADSGDAGAVQATLASLDLPVELDADAHRTVASLVALDATADDAPGSVEAVERALRPHETPDGPFATIEGYADVLDVSAREAPGVAVALALGHGDRAAALDAWRARAQRAHAVARTTETTRYSGLLVARTDGPTWIAARLLCDFRSPEPVVLAVDDNEATLAGPTGSDQVTTLETATTALEGEVGGNGDRAYATFDGEADALVDAVREAL